MRQTLSSPHASIVPLGPVGLGANKSIRARLKAWEDENSGDKLDGSGGISISSPDVTDGSGYDIGEDEDFDEDVGEESLLRPRDDSEPSIGRIQSLPGSLVELECVEAQLSWSNICAHRGSA